MRLTPLFFITISSLIFSTGIYAADQASANPSNKATTTPPNSSTLSPSAEKQKPIESKNASGDSQFTIVDENGNLKVMEDEKTKSIAAKPSGTGSSQETTAATSAKPTAASAQ